MAAIAGPRTFGRPVSRVITSRETTTGRGEAWRGALGLVEGSAQPAGMKVVAEWFPARERGVAGGIYQIGASFGAVFAPPLVAWAILYDSWRAAFFVAGGLGIIWVLLWLFWYAPPARHRAISPDEQRLIAEGQEAALARRRRRPPLGERRRRGRLVGHHAARPRRRRHRRWVLPCQRRLPRPRPGHGPGGAGQRVRPSRPRRPLRVERREPAGRGRRARLAGRAARLSRASSGPDPRLLGARPAPPRGPDPRLPRSDGRTAGRTGG